MYEETPKTGSMIKDAPRGYPECPLTQSSKCPIMRWREDRQNLEPDLRCQVSAPGAIASRDPECDFQRWYSRSVGFSFQNVSDEFKQKEATSGLQGKELQGKVIRREGRKTPVLRRGSLGWELSLRLQEGDDKNVQRTGVTNTLRCSELS